MFFPSAMLSLYTRRPLITSNLLCWNSLQSASAAASNAHRPHWILRLVPLPIEFWVASYRPKRTSGYLQRSKLSYGPKLPDVWEIGSYRSAELNIFALDYTAVVALRQMNTVQFLLLFENWTWNVAWHGFGMFLKWGIGRISLCGPGKWIRCRFPPTADKMCGVLICWDLSFSYVCLSESY